MSTFLTILATAILFLTMGILVGVWLRDLTRADSPAHAGLTPPELRQQPPASIPFPEPPSTTQHPVLHTLVLLAVDPPTEAYPAIRVVAARRPFRLFYQSRSWEHYRDNDAGQWCYRLTDGGPKPVEEHP